MKRTLIVVAAFVVTGIAWYMAGYYDGRNRGFRMGVDATIAEVERQTEKR